jgi:hypothetical protein
LILHGGHRFAHTGALKNMRLWQEANDRTVRLQLERCTAVVDPLNPGAGLQQVTLDGRELPGFQPLAPQLEPVEPSSENRPEWYVRGGDLVTTYSNRPAANLRSQVYWRASSHERMGAIAAVELLLSVQTSLLDSHPRMFTHSRIVAGEASRLNQREGGTFVNIVPPVGDADPEGIPGAPHCYLFRLPGRQYSYVEMVHPDDTRDSTWDGWLYGTDYRLELRHELFSETLEKGVILRARVLGVILDRRDDKAAALRHWEAFLRKALPLTA